MVCVMAVACGRWGGDGNHFYFFFQVRIVLLKVTPLEKNVSCKRKAQFAWKVCGVKMAERWKLPAR